MKKQREYLKKHKGKVPTPPKRESLQYDEETEREIKRNKRKYMEENDAIADEAMGGRNYNDKTGWKIGGKVRYSKQDVYDVLKKKYPKKFGTLLRKGDMKGLREYFMNDLANLDAENKTTFQTELDRVGLLDKVYIMSTEELMHSGLNSLAEGVLVGRTNGFNGSIDAFIEQLRVIGESMKT